METKKNSKGKKSVKRGRARSVAYRLGVFYYVILLAFVGLSVRLLFIVKDNSDEYKQIILAQKAYESNPINAKRGEILDANGTVLASSKEIYTIILDVKVLLDQCKEDGNDEAKRVTLNALSKFFGSDINYVSQKMNEIPDNRYLVVKRNVSAEQIAEYIENVEQIPEEEKETSLYTRVTGVWYEKNYTRYYPLKTVACDVIGFTKSDEKAAYGLEGYYNDLLIGSSGRSYGYINDDGAREITTIPAVDGNTIVTTLDMNVQTIVEKYLKQFCEEYKDNARPGLGANNIGCIVMRAKTGEILAMASYPSFDLNAPDDLSFLYSEEELKQMAEEDTLDDARFALWRNFCIADTYEPGSVMKPFTVAMGLETGTLTGNESYYCGGFLNVGGHDIYCHTRTGEGWLDVKGAIAQSCNVCLMYMAKEIGINNFLDYQRIFNIGLKTNVDLEGESRTDGLVFNSNTLNETELATASFGQGFNVTMIQMIAGYAALVNGGYYYEPHMVSQILNSSGAVVKNIEPRLIKQVVSNATSDQIREYCNGVVTDGTGWRAKPAGYAIGGKTGTAETVPRGNGEYVVSFMCHAPADNPEIICYVVIDRPNVSIQEDAKYSSIVSRQILTEILPYLNIYMTEELTEAQKQELIDMELSVYTNRVEKEDAQDDAPDDTKNDTDVNSTTED